MKICSSQKKIHNLQYNVDAMQEELTKKTEMILKGYTNLCFY